ncbi:MAG TPA: exodeoxyribonuclease VII small subunit [Thermoanaerobaculia bacterium]|nr:exodeoxyribonuclease VII small subunit [Thermoanaerobaculia bacterium]
MTQTTLLDSKDSSDPTGTEPQETPTFRKALDELEEILARIEGDETDIDQLGEELRRAAHLLEVCRGKIRKAEVEVTQIVQSLEEKPGPDAG